jgi:limonene-1,2-epoxide hydrolase
MSTSNEQIIRRFLDLWATREPEAMAALFAVNGVYDNVPNKQPLNGRAAIQNWLVACFEHLTRIDVEILNIASNGEWVLCERLDDHVIGERHMRLPVMNASRLLHGEIVMFRDYYDRQTVTELGLGEQELSAAPSNR